MKVLFALVALSLAVALVAARAPLLHTDNPKVIQDQYIVVFHKNSTVEIRDLHLAELQAKRFSGIDKIRHKYEIGSFIGYSAILSKATLASELEHANVQYITADSEVRIVEDAVTQPGLVDGLWGLDRIDERTLAKTGTYTYWASAGENVVAYVIDTGILTTHDQFNNDGVARAKWGANFITGEGNTDGNGHGTHVAGTIGGITYGVAKKVTLVAVKVLSASGSGSWDGVIAGINWVTTDHQARGRTALSVANMSLGGGIQTAVDSALENSVAAGVNHVVAAGNSNADACNSSPSRAPSAITVGATTNTDARASFSNQGPCLDVFAPGNLILSSWIGTNTATNTISGTSMASPHVAGVVALALGHSLAEQVPVPPTPTEIHAQIKANATANVLTGVSSTTLNLLVYSPHQTSQVVQA